MLTLSTVRSHDQFNTTIYSDNDRYRGREEPADAAVHEPRRHGRPRPGRAFDLIDITSHARDGSSRSVYGYRALAYDIPVGNVAGYMPELNVLCALGDYSSQSDQPLMKHVVVSVAPAAGRRRPRANSPEQP